MKKWYFTLLAAIILAMSGCAGLSEPGQKKVLRVATNAEFAPFESVDGQGRLQGFDIDLMNAVAQAGKFSLEWQNVPWDGIFDRLGQKKSDAVIAAVVIKDDRLKIMDFSEPYFNVRKVILVRRGQKMNSAADFQNKRVAVVKGQSAQAAAEELFGKGARNIIDYENLDKALSAVNRGRVAGMIGDSPVLEHYLKTHPEKALRVIELPQLAVQHYGIAVDKGDQTVLRQLNQALRKVHESGQYDEIYRRYFSQ